jgi:hypothetical protein
MLKYVAIATAILAVYFYWNKPNASARILPTTPMTKSVTHARTPSTGQTAPVAGAVNPAATSTNVVIDNKNKIYTYPEIQKMIVNDDVCALHKAISDMANKGEPPVYIDALLEALNLDSFKQLFGVEGPIFKAQEGKVLTPAQKFIDALATSEFFSGNKREQIDLEKSHKQLEELVEAYPDNAAYSLYKLALESQMGKTSTDLRGTTAQIAKAKSYDPGLFDMRYEIQKLMWTSPSIYYLSRLVASELPSVRVHKLRDVVTGLEDQKAVEHIGNLLVQKGLNSKRTYYSGEFDTSEYYYGNSFLNNKYPDVQELAESREPGKIEEINENWINYDMEYENCDRTSLDEFFQKMKNRF